MALRLNPILETAEIMNLRPRSTHGVMKLKDDDMTCMVELNGDFFPDLQGKRIQITPNPKYSTAEDRASTLTYAHIHPHQVGTTGIMTAARWAKVPAVSEEEAAHREAAGQLVPFDWKRMLYMEWFSQNGRVVLELIEPHIELYVSGDGDDEVWEPFEWPDTKPDDPMALEDFDIAADAREAVPFGHHYKRPKMDGMFSLSFEQDSDDDDDDANEIFEIPDEEFDPIKELERCEEEASSDLEAYLSDINRQRDESAGLSSPDSFFDEDDGNDDKRESVDELIAEMEFMEEVLKGKHDSDPPMASILGTYVTGRMTDGEAEVKLKEVLAQLALYGFSISICKHFTAKDTLRIIRDEWGILSKIHLGLVGGRGVRGYMTSESCRECDAEWEATADERMAEYERLGKEWREEQEKKDRGESPSDGVDDVPF